MTAIYWLRNDLRLTDNPALTEAVTHHDDVLLLYILDDSGEKPLGSAQRWWLHHSLNALTVELKKRNAQIIFKKGEALRIFRDLLKTIPVDAVYFNRVYEPEERILEAELSTFLNEKDIAIYSFNASLLIEPERIQNKAGTSFKVFTPYYKTVLQAMSAKRILPAPKKITQKVSYESDNISSWNLLPRNPDWSTGFSEWKPGESGAINALSSFLTHGLKDYYKERDYPAIDSCSHLSPHLHFGEISPTQIWHAIQSIMHLPGEYQKSGELFLKQLIWREFSYYLLFYHPDFYKENFRSEFNYFSWENKQEYFLAWQKGLTGYPIVDAGMRELWQSGYMHNRVRMIVASFLTKDLLIDWRLGEQWFWDTLLDADLANNSASWQWVAGSGVDAAPYFRIFNPVLQGEKFDPEGEYVKKWVPELQGLPIAYIHKPFAAPEGILQKAGVELGKNYPYPIVDHAEARKQALELYQKIR